MTEPFHSGEIALQVQTGERDKAILNGRMISSVIPQAARPFLNKQTCVAIGWADSEQNLWASFMVGTSGFASCDEEGVNVVLRFPNTANDLASVHAQPHGSEAVGMLFIELSTRRRLRVNGIINRIAEGCVHVSVKEAYPNCPKYIQRREYVEAAAGLEKCTPTSGLGAPPDLGSWLLQTDTTFVASAYPGGGVDCSHRGGKRGFIQLHGDELLIPDYAGNSMFCTLGNISVNPNAGLVLVDFENQRQLMLSGDARLNPSAPMSPDHTGGTGRWWSLQPRRWKILPLASGKWQWVDDSPFNP